MWRARRRRRSPKGSPQVSERPPRPRSYPRSQPLIERRLGVDPDGRNHGHARTERDVARRIVEDDLDGYALDDLDIIAGGVLGRQKREGGPRARLDAGDMALEVA